MKIAVVAYAPLMRGGKDQKNPLGDKIDFMSEPILKEMSVKYSKKIHQLLLNYQLGRGIAVIPKTEKL